MQLARRAFLGILALVAIAYLAAGGLIYAQQRAILFRPDASRVAPAAAGLPLAEEINLGPEGGPALLAWRIAPADAGKPVVLYLHGNSGNLARRAGRFQQLTRNGAGLLALSWRGYGGSGGEPSEAGFRADAGAALDYLDRSGIAPGRIVIFGESLGSGIAVMQAAGRPIRGLVLDSPYESIAAIAAERYWWLPVGLLIRDPFRAAEAAPRVQVPALALACTEDWVTPYQGSRRLVDLLGGPKRLITVDRRCHIPGFGGAGDAIMRLIEEARL